MNAPSSVTQFAVTPSAVTAHRNAGLGYRVPTDRTVKQRMRRYRARKRLGTIIQAAIMAGVSADEIQHVVDVTTERLRNISVTPTGYVYKNWL